MRIHRIIGIAGGAAAIFLASAPAAGSTAVSLPSGPGCHKDWPVVAHYAGGKVVGDQTPIIACANETGYYTGETGIGVTKNGTIYLSAADWEWALARSKDDGASWTDYNVPGPQAFPGCEIGTSALITPQCHDDEMSMTNTVADAYLYVDPTTSRVFWSKTYGFAVCSSLNVSDDGHVWHPVTQFACPGGDYEKIAAGPAPAGGAKPTGYPNVVYGCTNGYAPWFVVGPGRFCWHSLDGGLTWSEGGAPVVPSPLAPGCLHFQEPQRVGPDGTLYLPLGCGAAGNNPAGLVRVALSKDEGMTWSYVSVPTGSAGSNSGLIGGVSLAVDKGGALYVLWPGADNLPYLAVSKDQGVTWNGPLMVGMPGITEATPRAQVAALEPGHFAVAYYGYPTGAATTTLSGYLTESFNGTDQKPLLHSARLNDPAQPLYFPVTSGNLPRNDYLGVTIAPDGTPWTGLVKLVSKTPDSQGYIQSTGYAGRLVAAQPAAVSGSGNAPVALPLTSRGLNFAGAALLAVTFGSLVWLRRRRGDGGIAKHV